MSSRVFSVEQMVYLRSLPVVVRVTRSRITYEAWFKRLCVRRYRQGVSPSVMFREAGLDPRIIGGKRVERCMARWRAEYQDIDLDGDEPVADGVGDGGVRLPDKPVMSGDLAGACVDGSSVGDLRDVLIAQQIRYIAALEQQNEQLRSLLHCYKPEHNELAS